MTSQLTEQKNLLRRRMRGILRGLDAEDMAGQSAAVCKKVTGLPEFASASLVLCYRALARECDPFGIAACAAASGKRVAYPLCMADGSLQLLVPYDESAFLCGKFGISEPDPARSTQVRMADVDFAVIPGVAFDSRCRRMGHGAGYYDRLLENTGAVLVGIAFDEQILPEVPCGELDVRMDYVVSKNWIYCK